MTQGKEMQRKLSNTGHDISNTHFYRTCKWGRDTKWLMRFRRLAQWVSDRIKNRIQDPRLLKIFLWQSLFHNLLSVPCRNIAPRGLIKIELINLIKLIQFKKINVPVAFSVCSATVNFLLTSFWYWTQLNQTIIFCHLNNSSNIISRVMKNRLKTSFYKLLPSSDKQYIGTTFTCKDYICYF